MWVNLTDLILQFRQVFPLGYRKDNLRLMPLIHALAMNECSAHTQFMDNNLF